MPRKIKLNIEIEADFEVIGLSTVLKDYQLAFRLNNALGSNFKRINDFIFQPEKSSELISFAIYQHQFPGTDSHLCLLQNRNANGFILPHFRQADFFLIIQNPLNNFMLPEYISKIKPIPKINAAFPLNISGSKGYQAFVQDLELHLLENRRNA